MAKSFQQYIHYSILLKTIRGNEQLLTTPKTCQICGFKRISSFLICKFSSNWIILADEWSIQSKEKLEYEA